MIRFRRPACLTFVGVFASACNSTAVPSDGSTVRDSAGVEIVESLRPSWQESEGWRVSADPGLDLSGQSDVELSNIRSVRLLRDGRIAFFNDAACEIRIYDPAGNLQTKNGRCGRGPGEFEDFVSLWVGRGDSLLVIDQLTRVTVLAPGGSIVRTFRLPTHEQMRIPFVRGVLDDGTLLVAGLRDPTGRAEPGIERGSSVLGVMHDVGSAIRIVGSFEGPVFEYTDLGGTLGRGRLAFSSATEFAAGRDRLFVGFPDRYEIRAYDSDGTLRRIMRRALARLEVEQRDIDWLMERRLAEIEGEDDQRLVRQAFRALRHADVMPAFGVPVWPGGADGGPPMLADATGNLWVFEHYRPGEYRNAWTVFSPEGFWLGTVALPDSLTPSQITADHILGTWTDADGFVHVRRYEIARN